jgi:hypothetical protein
MKNTLRLLLLCLAVSTSSVGRAQDGTADERQACEPDVNRLCSEFSPDKDKIIMCLNQKMRQLSPACRSVILFYVQQRICAQDTSRLCGDMGQDRERTFACLSQKERLLSASCRNAFGVYARQRR